MDSGNRLCCDHLSIFSCSAILSRAIRTAASNTALTLEYSRNPCRLIPTKSFLELRALQSSNPGLEALYHHASFAILTAHILPLLLSRDLRSQKTLKTPGLREVRSTRRR